MVLFEKAGRDDLIAIENNELEIIIPYLPEQLGENEINALIDAALEQTGASSKYTEHYIAWRSSGWSRWYYLGGRFYST